MPYPADYGQRATKGGLIISEATIVGANGQGYPHTPGLFNDKQVSATAGLVQMAVGLLHKLSLYADQGVAAHHQGSAGQGRCFL